MRLGYLVAAALVAAAAAVWFALPFGGELGQRFEADVSTQMELDAGRDYAVWTMDPRPSSCEIYPGPSLDPAFDPQFVKVSDPEVTLDAAGRTWHSELVVRPRWTGPHTVACAPAGAIGAAPFGYSGKARALTLVSSLSLLLAGVALATLTARRAHRPLMAPEQ
jgi:hypothetical protein